MLGSIIPNLPPKMPLELSASSTDLENTLADSIKSQIISQTDSSKFSSLIWPVSATQEGLGDARQLKFWKMTSLPYWNRPGRIYPYLCIRTVWED
jgi:hypothetical protein